MIKPLPKNITVAVKNIPADRKMMKGIKADMKRCGFRSMAEFVRKCIIHVNKHGVKL